MAVKESMEEVRLEGLPEGFEEREKRVEEVKGVIDRNGERVREETEKVERRILEEREVLEGGVERGFDGDERKEEEEWLDINAFEIKSKIKHGNPSSNAQEQLQLASDSLVKLADKLKHKSSKEDNSEASKLSIKDSEMVINVPNLPELPHCPSLDSVDSKFYTELISKLQKMSKINPKEIKFELTRNVSSFVNESSEIEKDVPKQLLTYENIIPDSEEIFAENIPNQNKIRPMKFNKELKFKLSKKRERTTLRKNIATKTRYYSRGSTPNHLSNKPLKNLRVPSRKRAEKSLQSQSFNFQKEHLTKKHNYLTQNNSEQKRMDSDSEQVEYFEESCDQSEVLGICKSLREHFETLESDRDKDLNYHSSQSTYLEERKQPGLIEEDGQQEQQTDGETKHSTDLENDKKNRGFEIGKILKEYEDYMKNNKEAKEIVKNIRKINLKIYKEENNEYMYEHTDHSGNTFFELGRYANQISSVFDFQKLECHKLAKALRLRTERKNSADGRFWKYFNKVLKFFSDSHLKKSKMKLKLQIIWNHRNITNKDVAEVIQILGFISEIDQISSSLKASPKKRLKSCKKKKFDQNMIKNIHSKKKDSNIAFENIKNMLQRLETTISHKEDPIKQIQSCKNFPKNSQESISMSELKTIVEQKDEEIRKLKKEITQINNKFSKFRDEKNLELSRIIEQADIQDNKMSYDKLQSEYILLLRRANDAKEKYRKEHLKFRREAKRWKEISDDAIKYMKNSMDCQNNNKRVVKKFNSNIDKKFNKYSSEIEKYNTKQKYHHDKMYSAIKTLQDHNIFLNKQKDDLLNSITKSLAKINSDLHYFMDKLVIPEKTCPRNHYSETLCRTKAKLLTLLYIQQGHLADQTKWERQVKELQRRRKQQDQESMYMEYEGAIIGLKRVREVVDESSSAMVLPVEGSLDLSCLADDFSNVRRMAGYEFENACNVYAKQQESIKVGDAVVFPAGNLKYDKIIAAFCPHHEEEVGKLGSIFFLNKTIERILYLSILHGLNSILIPSFCTEKSKFPVELYAHTVIKTVKDYIKQNKTEMEDKRITICYSNPEDEQFFTDLIHEEDLQFPQGYFNAKFPCTEEEYRINKMELEIEEHQIKISDLLRINTDIKLENKQRKDNIDSLKFEIKELKLENASNKKKCMKLQEESKEPPRMIKVPKALRTKYNKEDITMINKEKNTLKKNLKPMEKDKAPEFEKKLLLSTTSQANNHISGISYETSSPPSGITDSSLSSEYVEGHIGLLGRKGSGIIKFE
ncbi:unnamed protein product [Moneuplotes crassus]|uniref:Macro domain-containing protein n=1 Tax=Euplotes crassus TaxID=5936 RepID=A0AAD1U5F3_EUPCR|nr:unnamed protein product [Moneuplotes crassus]